MAIISRRRVSVIGEWHKNLKTLNKRELKIPPINPMPTDAIASLMKSPIISNGVDASNLMSPLYFETVLNKIILTMSLNTPSPYTILKSFG